MNIFAMKLDDTYLNIRNFVVVNEIDRFCQVLKKKLDHCFLITIVYEISFCSNLKDLASYGISLFISNGTQTEEYF